MLGKDYETQECLVARALEVVGERWTLLIVRDAFFGVRRFNEFQEHLDVPRAVLSQRLKDLVAHGILARAPDPERRGGELYELTDAGQALWPVIYALRSWAQRYAPRGDSDRVFIHEGCGQELGVTGACACATAPPPDEVVTRLRRGARIGRTDRVSIALAEPHRLLDPLQIKEAVPR